MQQTLFLLKEIADAVAYPFFRVAGRRAWSPGYYTARKRGIAKAIDQRLVKSGTDLPPHFGKGMDERIIECPWVFSILNERPTKMLDAGSALNHRFLIKRLNLHQTQLTIMNLAPEPSCFWEEGISYVFGDLRETEFIDGSFDLIVSISTIEHIGLDNSLLYTKKNKRQEKDPWGFLKAIQEFRRLLRPGGECLITVPYGQREIARWYQVFDESCLCRVVDTFQPIKVVSDFFGYFPDGWRRENQERLAKAVFHDASQSRRPGPDGAAGARAVACLRLST